MVLVFWQSSLKISAKKNQKKGRFRQIIGGKKAHFESSWQSGQVTAHFAPYFIQLCIYKIWPAKDFRFSLLFQGYNIMQGCLWNAYNNISDDLTCLNNVML